MSKQSILNLVKAVAFVLIFVLFLCIISPILMPKSNYKSAGVHYYTTKVFHGEKDNTIDVFAMGDSNLYRSISPMEMYEQEGITAFDCAMPCARTVDLYYFLKDLFSCQSPKVVILETDATYISPPNYDRLKSPLRTNLAFLSDFLKSTDQDINTNINQLCPAVSYHSRWKTISPADFTTTPDYTTRHDSNKGFLLNTTINGCKANTHMKKSKKVEDLQPAVKLYMDKIVELCKENGAELLLYSAPSVKSWNYYRHNAISQYAKDNGLKYIDYNTQIKKVGIDWSNDTKDKGEHMNQFGAEKCSKYMADYLKKNFDLPDRRGDSNYSQWDDDLAAYKDAVALEKQKTQKDDSKAPMNVVDEEEKEFEQATENKNNSKTSNSSSKTEKDSSSKTTSAN